MMDIIKHFDMSLILMVLARRPPSIITTELEDLNLLELYNRSKLTFMSSAAKWSVYQNRF